MGDADVVASAWRQVELGRVVLFSDGQFEGQIAAIVEIIDHKRVLIENPTPHGPSSPKAPTRPEPAVPRHAAPLNHLTLTHIVIPNLPRGLRSSALRQKWEKAEVNKQWATSGWMKSREKQKKRRELNDFERFKVMRLRKLKRETVRTEMAKMRASAKS